MNTDVATYHPVGKPGRRERGILVALCVVLIATCIWMAATSGRWFMLLVQVPGLVAVPLFQWLSSRRTYRADAQGIHARGIMNTPWSAIESVKTPTRWDASTMVRMRETGEERSTGFPTSYAEQLARIGDKPLV